MLGIGYRIVFIAVLLLVIIIVTLVLLTYQPSIETVETTTTTAPTQFVLFSDNFDSYPEGTIPREKWQIIHGEWKVVTNNEAKSKPNLLETVTGKIFTLGGNEWKDYEVEVKAKLLKKEWGYGVIFRAKQVGNSYRYYMCTYDAGAGTIGILKEFENGTLVALLTKRVETDTNWHSMKVEAKGNEFKCYLDNNLIVTVTDKDEMLSEGKVGLKLWEPVGAYFDDFKVLPL